MVEGLRIVDDQLKKIHALTLACMCIKKACLFVKIQPDLFEMRANVLNRTQNVGVLSTGRIANTYMCICHVL